MTTLTKGQILAALPKLPKSDLEAVAAVANHLLGNQLGGPTGAAQPAATPLAAMVFDALSAALNLKATVAIMPATTVKKFNQQLPALAAFFDVDFKGWDANKIKQMAFLRMMMVLVKADLKRMQITATYTTMINNLHRMPEIFDNSFPGYREHRLAGLIMKQFEASNAPVDKKASVRVQEKPVRRRTPRVD